MAKVVSFNSGPLPNEPVPEIVAALERLLEEARSGVLRTFAFGCTKANGELSTGWQSAPEQPYAVAMAIMRLHGRFICRGLELGGDVMADPGLA